jgi:hypothetical protein
MPKWQATSGGKTVNFGCRPTADLQCADLDAQKRSLKFEKLGRELRLAVVSRVE